MRCLIRFITGSEQERPAQGEKRLQEYDPRGLDTSTSCPPEALLAKVGKDNQDANEAGKSHRKQCSSTVLIRRRWCLTAVTVSQKQVRPQKQLRPQMHAEAVRKCHIGNRALGSRSYPLCGKDRDTPSDRTDSKIFSLIRVWALKPRRT